MTTEATTYEPTIDRDVIQGIVDAFFGAFVAGPGCSERMDRLRALLIDRAVIVRTCGLEPAVMTVEEFIAPREALLTEGSLTDFREWPVEGRVEVFGDIAHWFGSYAKAGTQAGQPFTGRGMKTIQFVRTTDGWRISAAAWDDERDGLSLPSDAR